MVWDPNNPWTTPSWAARRPHLRDLVAYLLAAPLG